MGKTLCLVRHIEPKSAVCKTAAGERLLYWYTFTLQVAAQAAPPTGPGSSTTLQATYHTMQLVPCLCSVPKEDIDDSSSVVVQSSQQISNQ
jgi:hypothetical protein